MPQMELKIVAPLVFSSFLRVKDGPNLVLFRVTRLNNDISN